jgi:molybdopterin converting factor small subunit
VDITIKLDKILREASCIEEKIVLKSDTVFGCLNELITIVPRVKERVFDKSGRLLLMVLLNGKVIYQKDLHTRVEDGSIIQLITAISGG